MAHITDLNEVFQTWAWTTYQKTLSAFSRKLAYDQVNIELKWERVNDTFMTPTYTKQGLESPEVQVVYESNYDNDTDDDQEQTFRTEKETTSIATIKISRGFTRGTEVGFQLTLPEDLHDASKADATFGRRLHVESEEESTVERKMKWSVDTRITSRRRNVTAVNLEITENTVMYQFTMTVKLKGPIVAVIRNRTGRVVMTVEGDAATIIRDMKQNDWQRKFKDATVDPSAPKTVKWLVSGSVYFRYGVSQTVRTYYHRRHRHHSHETALHKHFENH